MHVFHLISSLGFFGAENVLIQLTKELRHTDFSPLIGVFKNLHNPHVEVAEEAKRHNLTVEIFPCNGKLDLKTISLIREVLEKNGVDIIHTHGYKSNLYALASSFGKNISLITTCHNWLGDDRKMKFYAWLDKFFLNKFDKLIAVSDDVKREILKHEIQADKVLIISNGVELERFNNHKDPSYIYREFNIDPGCKIIGTVGRLTEEKGHIYILQATVKIMEQYPKVVLLIVGDGPLRNELQERVEDLGIRDKVIFTGMRSDTPELYSLMEFFILSSITEGLPVALLEAMASKKPVIATEVGAVPKVIQDGHSGLLVEPKDVEGLSKAIIDLLENPDQAAYLALNGYEEVTNEFSSQKMAERYVEVYKEVLRVRRVS